MADIGMAGRAALMTMACAATLGWGALAIPPARAAAGADTTGTALVEWMYDTWSVPWTQVRGEEGALDPSSYATLMTIACQNSILEVERRARHLSPEDCEHRMAAIRADHDTALVFQVQLKVRTRSGSSELVRLGPRVEAVLEDDNGWRWSPRDLRRPTSIGMATAGEVKRLHVYHPQWMRGVFTASARGAVARRREVEEVEYWIRFPRRHPRTGERILTPQTRWLRLRLSDGRNEWVATWPFLPGGAHDR